MFNYRNLVNYVLCSKIPDGVKKPNIAIAAAASTSEDVCPWESGPSPSQQQQSSTSSSAGATVAIASTSSRKNSMHQLDSGSSSSEISVAVVTEVSDRLRRSCGLTQQNTLDADSGIHKLTAKSAVLCEPRRASVCVPITSELATRRTVSTFEDVASPASSPKVSNTSVTVSQCCVTVQEPDKNKTTIASNHREGTSVIASVSILVSNAPTISVSAATDETNTIIITVANDNNTPSTSVTTKSQQLPTISEPPPEPELPAPESTVETMEQESSQDESTEPAEPEPGCSVITPTTNPVLCCSSPTSSGASISAALPPPQSTSFQQLQLAPLAEPDSESPISELPPSPPDLGLGGADETTVIHSVNDDQTRTGGGQESKSGATSKKDKEQETGVGTTKDSDVCPWEDEETCKVDAPFRKTYATLGFL